MQSSEEFVKKELSKDCFLINLMRRKVHFSILISLPKTFSPSTINVRSKFGKIEKNRTFKKIFFSKNVPLDTQNAVLTNRSKFFSHCSKKVSLQVMSLLIPTSRRELIWTPRMQFRQTGWTCVASNPRTLCSKSEINENLQKFQKIIFTFKMILWRHWVQFSILISLP